MKSFWNLLATLFCLLALVLLAVALAAGCAPVRSADPYTAAASTGITRVNVAAESAKWSNDQVIYQSVGDVKTLAESTGHSIGQVRQGVHEASAANAKTAKYLHSLEADRAAQAARVKAYDASWTGGKPRRIWRRIKLFFWIAVGVLAADWIALTFFSASPVGRIAAVGWKTVNGAFSMLLGWFRKTPAAPAAGPGRFMSP